MKQKLLKRNILTAMLLAVGMILPLFTAQIKEVGDTLLPMHLPILLCGLICGPFHGLAAGFSLPFLRSLIFGRPLLYPNAFWMAPELAAYGLVVGLLYRRTKKNIPSLYLCLIIAMLAGRAVWGISKAVLLGFSEEPFTFTAFITGGFFDAIPGILLQLVFIPSLMALFKKVSLK